MLDMAQRGGKDACRADGALKRGVRKRDERLEAKLATDGVLRGRRTGGRAIEVASLKSYCCWEVLWGKEGRWVSDRGR